MCFPPCLVGVFDKRQQRHIAHQMQPDHRDHVGKGFPGSGLLSDYHHQQLGDQHTVHLHFDGIAAVAPKVAQWKILLYLLEQQLNHPAVLINGGDLRGRQCKVVGDKHIHFAFFGFVGNAPQL